MLIWHKIAPDGKYNMRTNMALVQDFEHLKTLIETYRPRILRHEICINDMACVPGNAGLWRVTNCRGEIIGEAYDPDVYRLWPDSPKKRVIPAYERFYDENGKFSGELFRINYKKAA